MALSAGDIITYNGTIWVNQPAVQGPFGIGTAGTPSTSLQIEGNSNPAISFVTFSSVRAYLAIPTGNGAYSDFAINGDLVLRSETRNLILTARNGAGDILFGTGSADTVKMRVTNAGDVSIGPSAPGVSGFDNARATALSGDISPSALTGNVNDYAPTGLSTATVLRVDPGGAARQITGITGGADGRLLLLCNVATGTTNTITLVNDSASSTAANRILGINGANVVIRPGGSCLLWYDSTSSRWRCASI